jgi:hypothetical protein
MGCFISGVGAMLLDFPMNHGLVRAPEGSTLIANSAIIFPQLGFSHESWACAGARRRTPVLTFPEV